MAKFVVGHSKPLNGTVSIGGSKNAVLPILAACLLTEDTCVINSVPVLSDVFNMINILKSLGAEVDFDIDKEQVTVSTNSINRFEEEYHLAGKMRASFLIMGPLLAKYKNAVIPLPGGCPIGSRPIDLHLKGFISMGAKLSQIHGSIDVKVEKLLGNKIYLDFPSVGATENIMMAATLAEGVTIIENAAVEPEVCDLANFLIKMGARIKNAGTDTIEITGVDRLKGTEYTVIPDRIEAGTYMVAAAITKGDVTLNNVVVDHLKPIIAKLEETNCKVEVSESSIRVTTNGEFVPFNLKTMPYPGFPTDMQAPFMSLMTLVNGIGIVTETVFENRFMHAGELKRMGADINIDSRSAIVEGGKKLTGTQVKATDLRAGAALILSALVADGETEISDIYHIDRGYYKIDEKLKLLGAKIERKEEKKT